jgi:4a-hydroxytetrahydrobiopterin dehydratase
MKSSCIERFSGAGSARSGRGLPKDPLCNRFEKHAMLILPPGLQPGGISVLGRRLLADGGNVTNELAKRKCIPCRGGTPPLKGESLNELFRQLNEGWKVVDDHHLERDFKFPDFRQALAFTNQVGELAETEGHHPDIHLSWGKVRLVLWTHKIGGLSESDFIFAAKVDEL